MRTSLHRLVARTRAAYQSFLTKLVVLLAIFLTVPWILFAQFRAADEEKNTLLRETVQEEGQLITRGLIPAMTAFQQSSPAAIRETVARLASPRTNVKVLLRPEGAQSPDSFFFVASEPPLPEDYLDLETAELVRTGVFEKLRDSCEGNQPLAVRYTSPAGREEVLTSITPVNLAAGCWVVITSHATADFLRSSLGRPYWTTPRVQMAAIIYLAMAAVIIWLVFELRHSLDRFRRAARNIRTEPSGGASFAELNRIPELSGVAEDFDRLVRNLRESSVFIRQAAEENAHALKAPLAVISQSIEPVKTSIEGENRRAKRGIELIEQSVMKLDRLVSAARRMDRAAAELLDPPREAIDFSRLLNHMLDAYSRQLQDHEIRLACTVEPGCVVRAGEELLETIAENLIDNAASFSPCGGTIDVTLRKLHGFAEFVVSDEGPGVEPRNIERIFDRYFSLRPDSPAELPAQDGFAVNGEVTAGTHFGIGLWIVRRNAEAVGGNVSARNRNGAGLAVSVSLPLVS